MNTNEKVTKNERMDKVTVPGTKEKWEKHERRMEEKLNMECKNKNNI